MWNFKRILGPHFYHETLTGVLYLHFLQNELPLLLEDVPIELLNYMWLHQDGAPAHNANKVIDYFNQTLDWY